MSYDIRSWEYVKKIGAKKQRSWVSDNGLERAFNDYHGVELTEHNIPQKIQKLKTLKIYINRQYAAQIREHRSKSILRKQLDWMKNRQHYLEQLHKYMTDKCKQERTENLFKLIGNRAQPRIVKPGQSGFVKTSVTWPHADEKLDPMHRSIFDRKFKQAFDAQTKIWMSAHAQSQSPRVSLCTLLVRFLIDYEKKSKFRQYDKVVSANMTDNSRNRVYFSVKNGVYMTYYAKAANPNLFERYHPMIHMNMEIATPKPYHTCKGGGYINAIGRERRGEKDFKWADLYVMRKKKIFTTDPYRSGPEGYPVNRNDKLRIHAMLSGYKKVEAAGMMIARKGLVLGLDNESGHYTPGLRELEQAVKVIKKDKAFAKDAFVCVSAGRNRRLFFPLETFVNLSSRNFPLTAMIDASVKLHAHSGEHIIGSGEYSPYLANIISEGYNWDDSMLGVLKQEYKGWEALYDKARKVFPNRRWSWNREAFLGKLNQSERNAVAPYADALGRYDAQYEALKGKFRNYRFVNLLTELDPLFDRQKELLQAYDDLKKVYTTQRTYNVIDTNPQQTDTSGGLFSSQSPVDDELPEVNVVRDGHISDTLDEAIGRVSYEINALTPVKANALTLKVA